MSRNFYSLLEEINQMLLEIHCHTSEHSECSHVGAVELVRGVYRRGLDGLVITDHHYRWRAEELRQVRMQAGVADNFLILTGQEVSTGDAGDILVFGAGKSIAKGAALQEIASLYPAAALVWAHPFRNGQRPRPEQLFNPLIDAVEIFNSNHSIAENIRGLNAWHFYKFIAVAGTDTHAASYAGNYPTLFDHPVTAVEALAEEIRNGRCRPYLNEVVRSGTHLTTTEITIGGGTAAAPRDSIIIKTFPTRLKWKSAERTFHLMKTIFNSGFDKGRFRIPRPIDGDAERMIFIEQGLQGISFFEKLIGAKTSDARYFTRLAARWLAEFHNRRFQLTPPREFLKKEPRYLSNYLKRFDAIGHRHARRAGEIAEAILSAERRRYLHAENELLQGHGDYHPKNIYICQDDHNRRNTLYTAVIDFDSSRRLPPAFDVGTFLAQFRNQFFSHPSILEKVPDEIFLNAYLQKSTVAGRDFLREVELFRARTNLNIAAYLIRLGLGDSENLWRVIVEAERAMIHYNA